MSYKIEKQATQILLKIQDDLTIAEVKGMWEELLAAECGHDPALRGEVESLLQAHDDAGEILTRANQMLAADNRDFYRFAHISPLPFGD